MLLLRLSYFPLPNFGLFPKKSFTVFGQPLIKVTETVVGAGAGSLFESETADDDSEEVEDGELSATGAAAVAPAGAIKAPFA